MRYNGMRVLTQFLQGHHPGPDAAISKLYWSEYHKLVTELAVDILGADAMVPEGRRAVVVVLDRRRRRARTRRCRGSATFLNARAGTIYAGLVAGPAQHHRRDGARSAEGASPEVIRVAIAVLGRPSLWPTAVRHGAPNGDDRAGGVGRPFLPVPSGDYLRFRLRHPVRRNRSSAGSGRCAGLSGVVPRLGSGRRLVTRAGE